MKGKSQRRGKERTGKETRAEKREKTSRGYEKK